MQIQMRLWSKASRAFFDESEGALVSDTRVVPVIDGVPDFLAMDAEGSAEEVGVYQVDYTIWDKPTAGIGKQVSSRICSTHEARVFVEAEEGLGRKLDVLDVGCGSNKFLRHRGFAPTFDLFCNHSRLYAGVEPSWDMLKVAISEESRLPELENYTLIRGVGEDLPFADGSFDLVMIKSTLDHCTDADATLAESFRVLRDGGVILITLQNFDSWQRRLIRMVLPRRYAEHRKVDHHNFQFTPSTISYALRNALFGKIELREFGYWDVTRYGLATLENVIFAIPRVVLGPKKLEEMVARLDRAVSKLLPGIGGGMVVWGEKGKAEKLKGRDA